MLFVVFYKFSAQLSAVPAENKLGLYSIPEITSYSFYLSQTTFS
jgi:hypothetical protein